MLCGLQDRWLPVEVQVNQFLPYLISSQFLCKAASLINSWYLGNLLAGATLQLEVHAYECCYGTDMMTCQCYNHTLTCQKWPCWRSQLDKCTYTKLLNLCFIWMPDILPPNTQRILKPLGIRDIQHCTYIQMVYSSSKILIFFHTDLIWFPGALGLMTNFIFKPNFGPDTQDSPFL